MSLKIETLNISLNSSAEILNMFLPKILHFMLAKFHIIIFTRTIPFSHIFRKIYIKDIYNKTLHRLLHKPSKFKWAMFCEIEACSSDLRAPPKLYVDNCVFAFTSILRQNSAHTHWEFDSQNAWIRRVKWIRQASKSHYFCVFRVESFQTWWWICVGVFIYISWH